jgi:predicted nucleic acid-binding protein
VIPGPPLIILLFPDGTLPPRWRVVCRAYLGVCALIIAILLGGGPWKISGTRIVVQGNGQRPDPPMGEIDIPYSEAGARVAQQRRELTSMARYVIGPDVAIRLAHDEAVIRGEHQILAPTLLRSQVLSLLYQAVRRGEMTRRDAERQLDYVRGLRIRLLGDRVLQEVAWKAAGLLGWPDTFDAEYVALTQLHADALITLDRRLAHVVKDLVTVAPIEALY